MKELTKAFNRLKWEIEVLVEKIKKIIFRHKFGHKYNLGLLPTTETINEYVLKHGTLISKTESENGVYRVGRKVYSAYQRRERLERTTYLLDGVEYAKIEIKKL